MTVRVLEEKPSPEVEKKITCRHCGRMLAYVPNDVQERHGTDYSGGPDGSEWVNCPCGKPAVIRTW